MISNFFSAILMACIEIYGLAYVYADLKERFSH